MTRSSNDLSAQRLSEILLDQPDSRNNQGSADDPVKGYSFFENQDTQKRGDQRVTGCDGNDFRSCLNFQCAIISPHPEKASHHAACPKEKNTLPVQFHQCLALTQKKGKQQEACRDNGASNRNTDQRVHSCQTRLLENGGRSPQQRRSDQ